MNQDDTFEEMTRDDEIESPYGPKVQAALAVGRGITKALAAELYDALGTDTRPDGGSYVKLAPGSPKWMTDVAMAAHDDGDILPDDTIYSLIQDAAEYISEDMTPEEWEPDCYSADLAAWLAEGNQSWVDEAVREYGYPACGTLDEALRMGQYHQWEHVYEAVSQALDDVAADIPDEE